MKFKIEYEDIITRGYSVIVEANSLEEALEWFNEASMDELNDAKLVMEYEDSTIDGVTVRKIK